jgi:hypothetical protein
MSASAGGGSVPFRARGNWGVGCFAAWAEWLPRDLLLLFLFFPFLFLFSLFFQNFFKIAPNHFKPNPKVF